MNDQTGFSSIVFRHQYYTFIHVLNSLQYSHFFKMKYKVCVKCSKIFPAYSPHEEAGTCCESRDLIVVIGMRANRVSARAAEKVHD